MSLTEVVSTRSLTRMMCCSISSAGMPVYCQTTLTTGMLISGKMSVDMRLMATRLTAKINRATTTKV